MRRMVLILLCLLCCEHIVAQQRNKQQLDKFNALYSHLSNSYVDELDFEPLVDAAIRATIKELDPHSSYLTREDMANLRIRLRGEFAGVGIRYILHNDTIVVRNTIPNSPAERANIRPNDRITAINNKSIIGLSTDSIATLLRGANKTKVELDIVRRKEGNTLNIKIQRSIIESSAIGAAFRINDVGYIAVSHFSKLVASEFYAAYQGLGEIKSLIVDLRNNGGGVITGAIDLTGLFLKKGDVILSTEGRNRSVVYDKRRDGIWTEIPLVVLINENSASASEIFAGAIQDHDRGVIVGRTSYGKGLVQRVIDFKDGSGVCMTYARYKTPSGRIIQRPYTLGHGDEYKYDSLRYQHADSISYDHRPQYTTLHNKRTVYGGGGITPDIYIRSDSTALSPRLKEAYNNASFEHCVLDIWDRVSFDDILNKYPSMEEFYAGYELNSTATEFFYKHTGLTVEECSALDREFIATMLLATMAEQLYGSDARYYIYGMSFDPIVQRGYEVASDETLRRTLLKYE